MYYLVFDHEAKKISDNYLDNGISYLGYYKSDDNKIYGLWEHEIPAFKPIIENADLVIGYNIKKYDLPILKRYIDFYLPENKIVDLFEIIYLQHNIALKLDNIASTTLGKSKIADSIDAVRFFNEGKLNMLKEYCDRDVEITKDLYNFVIKNGYILYTNGINEIIKIEIKIQNNNSNKKDPSLVELF